MTTRCGQCASELEQGVVVCVHCGAPADQSETSAAEGSPQLFSDVQPANAEVHTPTAPEPPVPFSSALLDADRHLEGLSGWLILVGIGLAVSPFVILGQTLATNVPLLTSARYHAFLASHPALEGMIVFEVATNLIFVMVLAGLNFLFYKKKRAFPTYLILYLILQVIVISCDAFIVHGLLPAVSLAGSYSAIARSFLGALIWIPYLVASRRVKVTFVH